MDNRDKEALIEKYRDINVDDDWWGCIYAEFTADMLAIGVRVDNIYFSGFYSQGDGACFEGQVVSWGLFLPHTGYGNSLLVAHAVDQWGFGVRRQGSYYHENSIYFDAYLPLPTSYNDTAFMDEYCPHLGSLRCYAWLAVLRTFAAPDMEGLITEFFKELMRELYRSLEEEYAYLTSDEVVWASIEANELDQQEN